MESSQSNPPTSPNSATSPVSPKSPSKIPRRTSSKRIALPNLKSALERAVKARGKTYSQITAFVCYWDDDNNCAQEDGETFSHMMADLFGVASQTFVMNHENPVPGWDLGDRLHQEVMSKHRICKPTLFIFFLRWPRYDQSTQRTFFYRDQEGKFCSMAHHRS